MEQFLLDIQAQAFKILTTILVAIAGYVGKQVANYFKEKGILAKLEHNKGLVKIVVHACEQVFVELDGAGKYDVVKEQVLKILADKKIKISENELDNLIESTVKEMNDSYKKELAVQ